MSKYSIKLGIISIVAGVIYGVIGEVLYGLLHPDFPRILVTAIYFIGLFIVVSLALSLGDKILYRRARGKIKFGKVLLLFFAMFAAAALLEFVYDLVTPLSKKESDSYIFLLDCSGSMDDSDPDGLRYEAMNKLLETKDDSFQYAVYLFSHEITKIRDLKPVSDGIVPITTKNDGGTYIKGVLETVLEDYDSGAMNAGGKTRVILLSDGAPTDFDFSWQIMGLLKEFSERDISVSTVGLLYADADLMNLIAEKTNGIFINVDNIEDLEQAMQDAGAMDEDKRNLLGFRMYNSADLLLAIMRIVFITVLGLILAFAKTEMCENFTRTKSVFISSVICGILAGLAVEIGINGLGLPQLLIRLLACVLLAFTLLEEEERNGNRDYSGDMVEYDY